MSNETFSDYFDSKEQIEELLERQKQNFLDSILEDEEGFNQRFLRLGDFHFKIGIPYEIFLAGSKILNKKFINVVINENIGTDTILEINEYFENSMELMAKGYLMAFVKNDRSDIEGMIEAVKRTGKGKERELLLGHYTWLRELFLAIELEDMGKIPELDVNKEAILNITSLAGEDEKNLFFMSQPDIEKVYKRILNNVKNIFYFLDRNIYTEALSLFVSLLEIYKFTLVFSNMLSTFMTQKAEELAMMKTRLAEEDALTGVLNRRKFDEIIVYAVEDAKYSGRPLSLLIADIDRFKHINDTYGHDVGDCVLRVFAKLIGSIVRKNDILLRYGGEEFIVICFDTRLEGAVVLAQKIQNRLKEHMFETVGKISASYGISELNHQDSWETLFKRADGKLYEAKEAGRDCVRF